MSGDDTDLRSGVRALSEAFRRLAAGAHDARLPEGGGGELGELARSFNLMAEAMQAAERSRRQWVTDTSHELRTPIAVLRAQIEALQDGIHQPDARTLGVLHTEVMGLSKIVEDLYSLARSDFGTFAVQSIPVEPLAVFDEVLGTFTTRLIWAGLGVEITGRPAEPWLTLGDPLRLRQLFTNLLENSARYTDAGGGLRLVCQAEAGFLRLELHDSAPGVPPEDLPLLFERFYRVEGSRNRELGGSGLGLAICRTVVEAHGGTIAASVSPMGGLCVAIVFPKRNR